MALAANRKEFISLILLLISVTFCVAVGAQQLNEAGDGGQQTSPPHIIIFLVDCLVSLAFRWCVFDDDLAVTRSLHKEVFGCLLIILLFIIRLGME